MKKKEYTFICNIDNKHIEEEYPDDMDITVTFNTNGSFKDFINGVKQFAFASGFTDTVWYNYFDKEYNEKSETE